MKAEPTVPDAVRTLVITGEGGRAEKVNSPLVADIHLSSLQADELGSNQVLNDLYSEMM